MMRWSTMGRKTRRLLLAALLVASGSMPGVSTDAHAEVSSKLLDSDAADVTSTSEGDEAKSTTSPIRRVSFAAALNSECDACDSVCCQPELAPCVIPRSCCAPCWAYHRTGGFGEFLYLFPGSTDYIFAQEQTDPQVVVQTTPTGPVGISSVTANTGFRVGFAIAASNCSSVAASYTRWDGDDQTVFDRVGNNTVLISNFLHPSTGNVGSSSQQVAAQQDMSFQTVDIAYRHLWRATDATALNWKLGFRYGNMEQQFIGAQTQGAPLGLNVVTTDIDFNGFGLTSGVDFERYSTTSGLLIYGKSLGSLLAGDWTGTYNQVNQFGGGVVANNQYDDTRVTPVVDLEVGLGWQSKTGRLRATTGYTTSAWFNALSTRTYIDAFNTNRLLDASDTLTFNGLVSRIELNF